MAVAGDVCDGVFLCCHFSHKMSWMRSWTNLSRFLRVFLPTLGSAKTPSIALGIAKLHSHSIALGMAKTLWSFGCSKCNRVEGAL